MYNEDYETIEKRKAFFGAHSKLFIGLGAGLFLLIVAIIIGYLIYTSIYSASVKIVVAPKDAKIMIGDKRFKNGEHRIKPGDYDVNITHDGFENYTNSFSVEKGEQAKVYVCMDNNDGVNWYDNDKEFAVLCDEAYEYLYDQETREKYADKIFSITPFHSYDKGFNIDAELNEETGEIVVSIYALSCKPARIEGLNQNALEWLRKAGVNPDDYTIKFTNEGCDKE